MPTDKIHFLCIHKKDIIHSPESSTKIKTLLANNTLKDTLLLVFVVVPPAKK